MSRHKKTSSAFQRNAKRRIPPEARDAFFQAVLEDNFKTVSEMVEKYPGAPKWRDHSRGTALMNATVNRHEKMMTFLLTHGANINAKDYYGCTALMYAASGGVTSTVSLLLEHNVDLDIADRQGDTAEHRAHRSLYGGEVADVFRQWRVQEALKKEEERIAARQLFHNGLPYDIPAMRPIVFKKRI